MKGVVMRDRRGHIGGGLVAELYTCYGTHNSTILCKVMGGEEG